MNRVRKVIVKLPALLQNIALLDEPIMRVLAQHAEFQIEEADISNVRLAVKELCANIIRHAYNGERGAITLTLEMDPATGCFTVITLDKGKYRFDWTQSTPPELAEAPEYNLGISHIRQLVDEVNFAPLANANQWRLAKSFPRRTPPTIPPAPPEPGANA